MFLDLRQCDCSTADVARTKLASHQRLRFRLRLLFAEEYRTALGSLLYGVVDLDLCVRPQEALILILAVREVARDRLDILLGYN